MTNAAPSSETLHASCVMIDGAGVLLHGASGAGKSDLALRLIDRGASLVSDDYTFLRRVGDRLLASPPETIAGRIEVRGLGLIDMPYVHEAYVRLLIALDEPVPRMPEDEAPTRWIAGVAVPVVALAPLEPSAPIKVELALRALGLGDKQP
jgi:serine kinase of HPr protein (carbohydrate metabolism regulator)